MKPHRSLAIGSFFLVTLSTSVLADDSCGMRVAGLMASGKTSDVAALFAEPLQVVDSLQRLAGSLGQLTRVQEVATVRFAQNKRISVQPTGLSAGYKYQGYRVNAHSDTVGDMQFHIARAPESTCKLLAIHVDTAW